MSATKDFLVELGTEELPPKALDSLSRAFEKNLQAGLVKQGLSFESISRFATPRRLALLILNLAETQPDKNIERFGPAVKAAYDADGAPTQAALGFAKSCGVELSELATEEREGVEKLKFSKQEKGLLTSELLPGLVADALTQLPIAKRMRWGSSRDEFVRPVHWLVLLFGSEVIPANILGIESSNLTRGHRSHHNKSIVIENPRDYEALLEETGHVIADFDKRKEIIRAQIIEEGVSAGVTTIVDEALLDEVTGLVELPVALSGKFDEQFLEVPSEALVLALKSHQKCFYQLDADSNLSPSFVTVSNIRSNDPSQVVKGNERVIRPRLADARFFFETDRRASLESRLDQLKKVVFQDQLGTVYEKSQRVAKLATFIANSLGADAKLCSRAAELSKCDLLTNMVGEFADLQGLMGYYYALNDGEPEEVAKALNEQYMPRFSNDSLPASITGSVLALSDKLDTMIGMFAIGQPPTGSKDPFALRRAALGVLRILIENEFDLNILETIRVAYTGYDKLDTVPETETQVFEFLLERFRAWYLDEGFSSEIYQSVFALRPERPLDFHRRTLAVNHFSQLPEAAALANANKRVSKLLEKQQSSAISDKVDESLLQEKAEIELYQSVTAKMLDVTPMFDAARYQEGLSSLAELKDKVDAFFNDVLVMSDDPQLQANRIALLQMLQSLFLQVADISYLHKN